MLNPWHYVSNTFSLYVYILVILKDIGISISYKKTEKWGLKYNLYEWMLIISIKLK